jgi:16S rRNA (uracil1498-N3)-methyltransferase
VAEHRFYAGEGALAQLGPGAELTLSGDAAHRIARVLRLRRGERVAIFGDGREFDCELLETGGRVRVLLVEELSPALQQPALTLYQALIRPNRFEWLIEKVTELGAGGIVPILSEHCAVRPAEIGASRLDRWRRIAVEAAEQCGRRTIPSIGEPIPYVEALQSAAGRLVFAWEGLSKSLQPGAIQGIDSHSSESRPGSAISLFIGPEGGWSDAEVEQARTAGATFIGLGPNILRAETAAIVAGTLLLLGRRA